VLSALDPFALLHAFLSLLSFDHSPLLDWLVGNETACLAYLHLVLRRVASGSGEFKSFAGACERGRTGAGTAAADGSAPSASGRCDSDSDSEREQEQEPGGLDAAMSCLIRLHLALKRLVDKVSHRNDNTTMNSQKQHHFSFFSLSFYFFLFLFFCIS
jgi:hypothetical protein